MSDKTGEASTTPTADRIRQRLLDARRRFHANDNIADFIEPGELDALQREVQAGLQTVLETLVIDVTGDHNTEGTAGRVATMFVREVFPGRYEPMPPVPRFPTVELLNELPPGRPPRHRSRRWNRPGRTTN